MLLLPRKPCTLFRKCIHTAAVTAIRVARVFILIWGSVSALFFAPSRRRNNSIRCRGLNAFVTVMSAKPRPVVLPKWSARQRICNCNGQPRFGINFILCSKRCRSKRLFRRINSRATVLIFIWIKAGSAFRSSLFARRDVSSECRAVFRWSNWLKKSCNLLSTNSLAGKITLNRE